MKIEDYSHEVFTAVSSGGILGKVGTFKQAFSLGVKADGAGASWTVILEGSLDGVNFTTILTHTDLDPGDGQLYYSGAADFPCIFHRVRVVALSLGSATKIDVNHLGV